MKMAKALDCLKKYRGIFFLIMKKKKNLDTKNRGRENRITAEN